MITLQHMQIASRLYDARDGAKMILGEKYHERMDSLQEDIREFMGLRNCEALPATMAIVTELQRSDRRGSGVAQMMILAAYVEMVEPSKEGVAA
jgi:hypothetical protein